MFLVQMGSQWRGCNPEVAKLSTDVHFEDAPRCDSHAMLRPEPVAAGCFSNTVLGGDKPYACHVCISWQRRTPRPKPAAWSRWVTLHLKSSVATVENDTCDSESL